MVGVHMVGGRVGELIGEAQLIYNWEALPGRRRASSSTPTRPRTRRSARRTSRWPASPCTPTPRLSGVGDGHGEPAAQRSDTTQRSEANAHGDLRHHARAGRERHRGHRHPLAEAGGRRRSRSTSRCSRSPPTRSTPRSPRPPPACCCEIKVGEDETVEVGAELAVIGDDGRVRWGRRAAAVAPRRKQPSARQQPAEPQQEQAPQARQPAGSRPRPARRTAASGRLRPGGVRHDGDPAGAGRVGHRGHRHPLAEAGRRRGRRRRAAARGVHRQGRHRDPLARRRHAARDQGRRGRDRRGRRRARRSSAPGSASAAAAEPSSGADAESARRRAGRGHR